MSDNSTKDGNRLPLVEDVRQECRPGHYLSQMLSQPAPVVLKEPRALSFKDAQEIVRGISSQLSTAMQAMVMEKAFYAVLPPPLLPGTHPAWVRDRDRLRGFTVERRETPSEEPSEGDRLAAFFSTSEHARYTKETQPKWEDLNKLLPGAKTFGGLTIYYVQLRGVVRFELEVDYYRRTGRANLKDWEEAVCGVSPNWKGHPWLLERYKDLLLAQELITKAIPSLPRVPVL